MDSERIFCVLSLIFIRIRKWVNQSWDHWNDLAISSDAPLAGITHLSGYIFSKRNPSVVRVSIAYEAFMKIFNFYCIKLFICRII